MDLIDLHQAYQTIPEGPQLDDEEENLGSESDTRQHSINGEYSEDEDATDSDDDSGFEVDEELRGSKAFSYTTEQLHHFIHNGVIDLNPVWQRQVVWSQTKQTQLVESIFRNFYIPPVLLAKALDEDGVEVTVCVDGKQRLSSILYFIDGQIPYKHPQSGKTHWFTFPDSEKGKRAMVPTKYKKKFLKKRITCVIFDDLSPGQEREIFQRVQLGVSLTTAEKLQAFSSPRARWISELDLKHTSQEGGLADTVEMNMSRGRNFQNMAQFVFCCHNVDSEPLPLGRRLEDWLSRGEDIELDMKRAIDRALTQFNILALDAKYNQAFKKITQRIAPVEFVFIGVLLFLMTDKSPNEQAQAIYNLRLSTRNSFGDVRMRGDVTTALWTFVKTLRQNPNQVLELQPDPKSRKSAKSNKRRRAGEDPDDSDYNPGRKTTSPRKSSKRSR